MYSKRLILRAAVMLLVMMLTATTAWAQGTSGDGYTLTVNGQDADNTTSKFFIDEAASEIVSLDVVYSPEVSNLYAVEIYSNVGRRDFWNADIDNDGVADAIRPPSGDLVTATTEGSYFVAIPMEWDASAQAWKKSIVVDKCGAYRLTARYKATETSEWVYYSTSTNSLRDHAVVISPKKVLAQRVYEVNGLTVKASAPNEDGRSTFKDLIEGEDGFAEFGIPYLNKIQANCLWLQPIHPSGESNLAQGGEPGNPYVTTDYFSVSKWYGSAGTMAGALEEFQGFVKACDAGKSQSMGESSVGTVNIMLDVAFGLNENSEQLWNSMGSYVPYWLEKTGHDFGNERMGQTDANGTAYDDYGIDGLRCASAEGLSPQFWEYFINRARSKKWNFMFIAEARAGAESAARCSRQFDVVDVSFETAVRTAENPSELLEAAELAEAACGGGTVLLNLARHDEPMPFVDPWKTASRYAMLATLKGMPMTFYGQEQGIEPLTDNAGGAPEGTIVQPNIPWTGFAKFELNSGTWIPDFKTWNKLTVWTDPPLGEDTSHGMAQLYGRVNRARAASPALRSDEQWMLDRTEGYRSTDVWAVAKAEENGALANGKDAVLAFVLFVNDTHYATSQTFSISPNAASMLGLEAGECYTARNLASGTPEQFLWIKTTEELTSEGVQVNFAADQDGSAFYDDGAMVQFLKLEKVQPYIITYVNAVDGEDGVTNNNDDTYTYGRGLDLVDATKEGYTFEGWYDNEAFSGDAITAIPANATGDITLWAKWAYAPSEGYYLVGTMTDWGIDPDYQMVKNTAATGEEYMIQNVPLYNGDQFKVVYYDVNTGNWSWFPEGTGNNYVIANDGIYNIYFRPNYDGGSDWFYNVIYVQRSTASVTFAPEGFATYYHSMYDIELPAGVKARIVTSKGDSEGTLTYETIADGDTDGKVVPAGTAVMLQTAASDAAQQKTLTLSAKAAAAYTGTNLLHGSDNETTTYGGAKYYKLTYNTSGQNFGWYWGAENGAAFTIPGHKAWLALPANAPAFLGLPDYETTGVTPLLSPEGEDEGASPRGGLVGVSWYTIDGRKLNGKPTTKGLYIYNGKKIIVK